MGEEGIESTLISILKKYDAVRIGIFGSYARGDAGPESDLDVLVHFRNCKSLLTLIRIQRELSEAIGIKVDLLTEAALNPQLRDRIRAEMRIIYQ